MIIEFSYAQFNKADYQYQTKLNQVINYKELMSNIISKNIELATYTFIIYPEDKKKDSNLEQIENFVEYLNYFLKDRKYNAYRELERISKL